jgi:hypothetical protein
MLLPSEEPISGSLLAPNNSKARKITMSNSPYPMFPNIITPQEKVIHLLGRAGFLVKNVWVTPDICCNLYPLKVSLKCLKVKKFYFFNGFPG